MRIARGVGAVPVCAVPAHRSSGADEGEAAQDLLDVDDVAGEELGDGGAHDVGRPREVVGDAVDLGAGEAALDLAEAEQALAGVDGVDVEVKREAGAAGGGKPVEQRLGGGAQVVGTEGGQALFRDVRVGVLGPLVEADEGDPFGWDGGREQLGHLGVAVAGDHGDGHGVVAVVRRGGHPAPQRGIREMTQHSVESDLSTSGLFEQFHRPLSLLGGVWDGEPASSFDLVPGGVGIDAVEDEECGGEEG